MTAETVPVGGAMRFLFLAAGYPGVPAADPGSGIGTYVREMALGLQNLGHECHVLTWCRAGAGADHSVEGVRVRTHPGGYWPVVERWLPDARRVWARGRAAARLDRQVRFDWVEVQSDEGVDILAQRALAGRAVLRVHTTLRQMCDHKQVPPTGATAAYLRRERKSFRLAARVVTHSQPHADEVRRLHPELAGPVAVVPHGVGVPEPLPAPPDGTARPRFLVVGTLDRRKGTDRLAAALAAYAAAAGPCELRVVSASPEARLGEFGLGPPHPPGVAVTYRTGLADADLRAEYRRATAVLQLARYESFGLAPVEAAAAGTPAVATPVGIAPELLTGPLARLLVDGDDPGAVAAALAAATRERAGLGAAAYDVYCRRFTRGRMVDEYLAVLERWRADPPGDRAAVWSRGAAAPAYARTRTGHAH